jgi:putative transposase
MPGQGVTLYPYLLRERPASAPTEVWSSNTLAQGFRYFTAVRNWHSRDGLSWKLSNTLDVGFCLQALATALRQATAPHIFNSGQGSQVTCPTFEQAPLDAGCRISPDGQGRARPRLHRAPLAYRKIRTLLP